MPLQWYSIKPVPSDIALPLKLWLLLYTAVAYTDVLWQFCLISCMHFIKTGCIKTEYAVGKASHIFRQISHPMHYNKHPIGLLHPLCIDADVYYYQWCESCWYNTSITMNTTLILIQKSWIIICCHWRWTQNTLIPCNSTNNNGCYTN